MKWFSVVQGYDFIVFSGKFHYFAAQQPACAGDEESLHFALTNHYIFQTS